MPETPSLQCRHIHSSGRRCASPSLRQELFCYFHHTSRKPIPPAQLQLRRGRQSTFLLPVLEDRTSIQLAIGEVLSRIAANHLDPKRAGLLLYGLQIAAGNLPKELPQQPAQIEEILLDDQYGPIAPESEFQTAPAGKTLEQILREQWAKDDAEEAERQAKRELKRRNEELEDQAFERSLIAAEIPPHPGTLPNLHAAAPQPPCPIHDGLIVMSGSTPNPNPPLSFPDPRDSHPCSSRRSTPNPHVMKILQKNRGGGTPVFPRTSNQHLQQSIPCNRIGE